MISGLKLIWEKCHDNMSGKETPLRILKTEKQKKLERDATEGHKKIAGHQEAAAQALACRAVVPLPISVPKAHRIVITGGPCAGKTSLTQRILREGLSGTSRIAVVPELATLAMNNGLNFGSFSSPGGERILHRRFLGALMAIEDLMYGGLSENATSGGAVLICDRGALDASAYCTTGTWQHVLADHNTSQANLCENRYDCVLFMRSVAVTAPASYSKESNSARRESASEAADVDERLLRIWSRHPGILIVDNDYASFDDKLDAAVEKLAGYLKSQSGFSVAGN